ncbi:unnamed protein product [Brassica napus]|uniref:(rape) hypothetical protein n=1 Tax=Brassica napus TaxID=3708 RepID=A0A816I271_BRANA|nr:unnamed protein product [Brassica napus]
MVNWRGERGESEVGEDRRASEMDKMSCETWITREVRRKDMMEAVAEPAQPPLRYIASYTMFYKFSEHQTTYGRCKYKVGSLSTIPQALISILTMSGASSAYLQM